MDQSGTVVGRYVVHDALASGGMASVHIGRLMGPVGFSRTVAIKILHPQYANDPEFVAMFVDEARLAARIRHPSVVATLDVVATGKDLFLVMEYVPGETFARLWHMSRVQHQPVAPGVASAIIVDVLDGLHAAHEARDEHDEPLEIVHRDVSPQNVIVGSDGAARVLDFGIAKATSRVQSTRDGEVKGKFPYMAPEQITRQKVDRRADVFATAVVLWEALTGRRLFHADNPAAIVARVMNDEIAEPSTLVDGLSPAIDDVVMKGLARDKDARYRTASDFARALEKALPPARRSEVSAWVLGTAHDVLTERARRVAAIERGSASQRTLSPTPEMLTTPGGPSAVPVTLPEPDETGAGRGARQRRAWFGYAGGFGLLASALIIVALRHAPANAAAVASPPIPPVEPLPVASAPELPEVAPAASGAPEVIVAPVVSATRSTWRRPPGARPQNGCDPPYTFNDAGVKRWKRACL